MISPTYAVHFECQCMIGLGFIGTMVSGAGEQKSTRGDGNITKRRFGPYQNTKKMGLACQAVEKRCLSDSPHEIIAAESIMRSNKAGN